MTKIINAFVLLVLVAVGSFIFYFCFTANSYVPSF